MNLHSISQAHRRLAGFFLLALLFPGCVAFQIGTEIQAGRLALMTVKPQVALAHFNRCGLIPRSLLRRDSGVGWVESFGVAQDRLRDTHRSPPGGYRRFAPPPTLQFRSKCVFFDTPLLAAGFFIQLREIPPYKFFRSALQRLVPVTLPHRIHLLPSYSVTGGEKNGKKSFSSDS